MKNFFKTIMAVNVLAFGILVIASIVRQDVWQLALFYLTLVLICFSAIKEFEE